MGQTIVPRTLVIVLFLAFSFGCGPLGISVETKTVLDSATVHQESADTIVGIAETPKQKSKFSVQTPLTRQIANLQYDFELLRTRYRFENDGLGNKEVTARIRVLNEMGVRQWSQLSFEYKFLSEGLEIGYVHILKKAGGIVNVAYTKDTRPPILPKSGVPSLDYAEKRINIPDLSAGDALEYEIVTTIRKPLAPGYFWAHYSFQSSGVLDEQLEINVPSRRQVRVKSRPDLKSRIAEENGRTTYYWRSLNSALEADGNSQTNAIPSDTSPDVQMSSFINWEDVGRWYAELEKTHRMPTAEVRAKADELTQGLKTDLDKIEALYNFAAKNIRYVSLASLGIGGYEPRSAAETLNTQQGDCKDKAALLAALLDAEGMHASSVLISSTREIEIDFPSPWPFDHVITKMQLGKDEIWMDPSPAVTPFRLLLYPLRKKEALVMPLEGSAHLEQTPADAPVPNTRVEEIEGMVDENGTLDATFRIVARGDSEVPLRQRFLAPDEASRRWTVSSIINGFAAADEISNVKISNPTSTNEPFMLSFRIIKPRFTQVWQKQFSSSLPPSDFNLATTGKSKGDSVIERPLMGLDPVHIGPTGEFTFRLKMEFAPRFTPEIPPNIALHREYGTYDASYSLKGNSLASERRLVIEKDELSPGWVEDYRVFRERIIEDCRRGMIVTISDKDLAQ